MTKITVSFIVKTISNLLKPFYKATSSNLLIQTSNSGSRRFLPQLLVFSFDSSSFNRDAVGLLPAFLSAFARTLIWKSYNYIWKKIFLLVTYDSKSTFGFLPMNCMSLCLLVCEKHVFDICNYNLVYSFIVKFDNILISFIYRYLIWYFHTKYRINICFCIEKKNWNLKCPALEFFPTQTICLWSKLLNVINYLLHKSVLQISSES